MRWRIGGAEPVEAEVSRAGDTVTVVIAGVTRCFEAVADGEGFWLREGEERRFVVAVGNETVVAGRRRVVAAARPGAKAPPLVVTPPMPGVVTRVIVADGASVAQNDALVAVTAMKMEVTLRAPFAGTARLRVAVGDKVMPGDVLVDVERT